MTGENARKKMRLGISSEIILDIKTIFISIDYIVIYS